jgi:hypothetical protein
MVVAEKCSNNVTVFFPQVKLLSVHILGRAGKLAEMTADKVFFSDE